MEETKSLKANLEQKSVNYFFIDIHISIALSSCDFERQEPDSGDENGYSC